ncbi:MAG: type II toxin-antitoxin system VapC family toxin [Gemmatimonadales bacterium]
MILDSSAIVAILLREPGYERLLDAIGAADTVSIGAPTVVESGMVVSSRLGESARDLTATMLREGGIGVVSFLEDHGIVALDAFLRYGKGRHQANLNFGDCIAYAVATLADEPLLFVCEDFRLTDIRPAL